MAEIICWMNCISFKKINKYIWIITNLVLFKNNLHEKVKE